MRGPTAFIVLLVLLAILYAFVLRYMIETRPTVGAVYLNPLRGVSRKAIPTLPIWFSITMILAPPYTRAGP